MSTNNITDIDLYNAARDAGVLIVTQAEEDAAIKFGRAVLALRGAVQPVQPLPGADWAADMRAKLDEAIAAAERVLRRGKCSD